MSWHIDFIARNKAEAVAELMGPLVQSSRGLPIAVREQVITMVEMLSDSDSGAFIHIKTNGHLTGERSSGAVNMTIEVGLIPNYVIPRNAGGTNIGGFDPVAENNRDRTAALNSW